MTERSCISIVAFCGLPGSGKTTLAGRLEKALVDSKSPLEVQRISFDDFLPAMFTPEAWKAGRRAATAAVFSAIRHSLERCKSSDGLRHDSCSRATILLDDTLHYRSMRYEYYKAAREHRLGFLLVHVCVPAETAKARNAAREGPERVPIESMQNVIKQYEPPRPDRYEFEQHTIAYPEQEFKTIFEHVQVHSFSFVPPPLVEETDEQRRDRDATRTNTIHQLDNGLRKAINSAMKVLGPAEDKRFAAEAMNAERKRVLAEARLAEYEINAEDILRSFEALVCGNPLEKAAE